MEPQPVQNRKKLLQPENRLRGVRNMPSEKYRYMERNCGPESPIDFMELKEHLPILGTERLIEIVSLRAEYDSILAKSLIVSIALVQCQNNLTAAKAAIDYALHLPDQIRYNVTGYGQIIHEITNTLQQISKQGRDSLALEVAQYVINRGRECAENFEDDWNWTSSLDDLEKWARTIFL